VALEGFLKVEQGRELSALLALGVDPELVQSIDDDETGRKKKKGEYQCRQ
jgi:hypothetical protein